MKSCTFVRHSLLSSTVSFFSPKPSRLPRLALRSALHSSTVRRSLVLSAGRREGDVLITSHTHTSSDMGSCGLMQRLLQTMHLQSRIVILIDVHAVSEQRTYASQLGLSSGDRCGYECGAEGSIENRDVVGRSFRAGRESHCQRRTRGRRVGDADGGDVRECLRTRRGGGGRFEHWRAACGNER